MLYLKNSLTLFLLISSLIKSYGQLILQKCDTVEVITYKIKGKTATGQNTSKIKEPFVAISRDLLQSYPLKSKIELYNCFWSGTYQVLDIMGKRHRKTIDIFYKGKKRNKMNCQCRSVG